MPERSDRSDRLALVALVVLLCAWCGWASGVRQSTASAFVVWAVSAVTVVALGVLLDRGRRGRRFALHPGRPADPWPRPVGGADGVLLGLSPWLAIALVVAAWEALGIDTGPHEPHLTVSALALSFRPFDAALFLVWILVGTGYGAARARAPLGRAAARALRSPRSPAGAFPGGLALGRHPALVPALLLPRSRAVGVAFWIVVVAACVVAELVARRSDGRLATAGELVRLVSGPPLVNVGLVVVWAYVGWHLFAH